MRRKKQEILMDQRRVRPDVPLGSAAIGRAKPERTPKGAKRLEPLLRFVESLAHQRVEGPPPLATIGHEAGRLEHAQVKGQQRLRNPERIHQVADALLAVAQLGEHGQPRRIGEGMKALGGTGQIGNRGRSDRHNSES